MRKFNPSLMGWAFKAFCYQWFQFLVNEIQFFGLFEAKMTKTVILDPKRVVSNHYQQFWVHFEWFLNAKMLCKKSGKI